MNKNEQLNLFYIHDPMCSWCWGFNPTWQKIISELPFNLQLKYLLGGLAPDSDEPMPNAMQIEIVAYWRKIQRAIPGTEFNFDFWENCEPRRSTYPACRAVIAARKQQADAEQEMITAIQHDYYLNAQNPSNDDTLIKLAVSLELDKQIFLTDLNSQETQKKLEQEIHFSRQIGAQGFPSLIIEKQGKYQTVPLDYNKPEVTLDFIHAFV